jgi:hypothetical protein
MKLLLAAALLIAPSLATAQAAPKPGPEVQALGYYVGKWEGHGETKAGPIGPAGKLSSHMTCDWFAGGYQVVCRGEENGPTGTRAFLNILSYDEAAKTYTQYSVSSRGETEYDRGGTLAGNKLTFIVEDNSGEKPVKIRYAETHLSADQYAYQAEMAVGGAPWTMLAEGKITKVK